MSYLLRTFILTLLLSVGALSYAHPADTEAAADTAPLWVLETIDGESIDLKQRITSGGNRIMVFWATWCPYCEQLMPIVARLKADYPDLEVLSFNVFDDLEVKDYPQKANWDFVHILGGDDFARVHGVKGLPTLFVLNGDGRMIIDLREIDTKGPDQSASHGKKAAHHAPLWEAGLRKVLDSMDWDNK